MCEYLGGVAVTGGDATGCGDPVKARTECGVGSGSAVVGLIGSLENTRARRSATSPAAAGVTEDCVAWAKGLSQPDAMAASVLAAATERTRSRDGIGRGVADARMGWEGFMGGCSSREAEFVADGRCNAGDVGWRR